MAYKDATVRTAEWAWRLAMFCLFLNLFGLVAFGLGIFSTATINKWDNCSKSNCVSSACTIATCIKGDCVEFDIPGCTNTSVDYAFNYLLVNDTTVNNNVNVGNALYLPTTGGTAAPLTAYEIYNFTTQLYGPFTTNQTVQFDITRIGNFVHFSMVQNFTATATVSDTIHSNFTIPARFRPSYAVGSPQCAVPLTNNGTVSTGCFTVASDGTITIGTSLYACATAFANGVTTLKSFFCSWSLANS
jgi:hypothetical protein